jgi:predicted dehydrogenase
MTVRVVLAGAGGYGRSYLAELAELRARGQAELVGVCDVVPLETAAAALVGDPPVEADLAALLGRVRPDIGIVATPIHLHEPMARAVLDAGAELLLEKPPTATFDGWRRLVDHPGPAARQVGFQSLGSAALPALRRHIADGRLGEVQHIGAWGAWSRPDGYYRRAPWAGHRSLDGVPVSDGVLTNPFAHAIATALAVDGSSGAFDVGSIACELWRARDIECDDTACVQLSTSRGTPVVVAATLCADVEHEPVVIVRGSRATAELRYTQDVLLIDGVEQRYGRTTPFADLLAHRADPGRLQSPLDDCGGFMRVLEALRTAPAPGLIPAVAARHRGEGDERRVEIDGIAEVLRTAAEHGVGLAEAGRPW